MLKIVVMMMVIIRVKHGNDDSHDDGDGAGHDDGRLFFLLG